MGELELYFTSFYFTVTTIMTVGYGDITAQSLIEKIVCIVVMSIGVVAFSFATGSISSIISNSDSKAAMLKEKMKTLDQIQSEYDIDRELYNKVMRAIQYEHNQSASAKGVVEFMDELPTKLRLEVAMAIH